MSISFSGRGILNGLAEGGYPAHVGLEKRVVHTAVEGALQLDTLYVMAHSARTAAGAVAPVRIEVSVLSPAGTEYTLVVVTLPGLPSASGPTTIVNGFTKNEGARIQARCLDGQASVFGWYSRSAVDLPPSVRTVVGQLTLGYQVISFASEDETRVVDTTTPLTFVTTSHTTEKRCTATLGAAAAGTVKYIVMNGKTPGAAEQDSGNFVLKPNVARFPGGETGPAEGTLTFQDVGDSAVLVFGGTSWMLLGTGAVVD